MKAPVKFLCAALALAATSAAYATSASQQPANNQAYQPRELTRAEVRADLAVWKRAGMDEFWRTDTTPDIYSREYRTAEAEYRRMRNGPEYQQELQRLTK
ncbi:Uncharacterised protein [Bordetella ansorpii]|uniref:Lipoprotein n=1 Tax=Bordetella ansorpii TaxID=288768 RepID=A0A157S4X5_9BORD|nr:DUF4148 domain-containing protein [Bordetella ansorpii]SAI60046.1 Uncharacterised protein [Bordetella ansorpii]SAI65462.1 Uncharacterised protein [Bordetella ansorpii]